MNHCVRIIFERTKLGFTIHEIIAVGFFQKNFKFTRRHESFLGLFKIQNR